MLHFKKVRALFTLSHKQGLTLVRLKKYFLKQGTEIMIVLITWNWYSGGLWAQWTFFCLLPFENFKTTHVSTSKVCSHLMGPLFLFLLWWLNFWSPFISRLFINLHMSVIKQFIFFDYGTNPLSWGALNFMYRTNPGFVNFAV